MADAQLMIERLNLKNADIAGRLIDLDELFKGHPHTGRYRTMVFQAAERILNRRGANVTWKD